MGFLKGLVDLAMVPVDAAEEVAKTGVRVTAKALKGDLPEASEDLIESPSRAASRLAERLQKAIDELED